MRHPWWILLLSLAAGGISLSYTVQNLVFNTDTTDMLSPDLPFHQDRIRFWRTFPQDVKSILLVVDSDAPELTENAIKQLAILLNKQGQNIDSVYIPGEGKFFDQQALLYLNLDQLDDLVNSVSNAQPFIGKLAYDNSLASLLSPLGQAITDPSIKPSIEFTGLLTTMQKALMKARNNHESPVSWQTLMINQSVNLNQARRFVLVKPQLDYSQIFPAQNTLNRVRATVEQIEAEHPGVRIRMTGEIALQHEELKTVSQGSIVAALASLVLVCLTLFFGLRSLRLMAATILSLLLGLILTAGFATVTVGHLNMISIAFAVLYIGLGVDYAIHFCLHYRDFLNQGVESENALLRTGCSVGPAIILCAITSSVGFFAFIPTSYSGVSELGIISGTSMFIGLMITLSVLPALLTIMPVRFSQTVASKNIIERKQSSFGKAIHSQLFIRWATIFLTIAAVALLPDVSFDFDPVHLRDPNTESVITYNDLLSDENASPLTMTVLSEDKNQALQMAKRLKQLDTVKNAVTLFDFVPVEQYDKLDLIDELALILGPLPTKFPSINPQSDPEQASRQFLNELNQAIQSRNDLDAIPQLIPLRDQLQDLLGSSTDPDQRQKTLQLFEQNLLGFLPSTMAQLHKNLAATPFDQSKLPRKLAERWLSNSGVYRIQVFPEKDMSQLENLREFVQSVKDVAPHATDLPVIYLEAGNEVVKAFRQALLTALIAISLLLLLMLRSIRDALLVLFPLVLAAMLTGAFTVVLNTPFNFANIIAVPLLFGLGVDSGIHMIHRLRNMPSNEINVLKTCTSRGVLFSALTTIFSFSSLAFSAHLGTASMGLLLAVGIFFTLLCTLFVLPAFANRLQSANPQI